MQCAARGNRDDIVVDSRCRFAARQWFWGNYHRYIGHRIDYGSCLRQGGCQRKDDHNSTAMANFEVNVFDVAAEYRHAVLENTISMQIASLDLQNENAADRFTWRQSAVFNQVVI